MPASVGLWGGLNCLLGRHVRSRGQARATPEGWVSRCARCAIPMARSHGGGSWQVVKTPKRGKDDVEATDKVLAKAIARSRKAAQRAEEKAAKLAIQAGMPPPAGYAAAGDEDAPAPKRRRGLFRRKGAKAKRARRLLIFRRKGETPAHGDGAEPTLAVEVAHEAADAATPRRGLLGRAKRAKGDGAGSEPRSLAQETAAAVIQPRRSLLRRKRRSRPDTSAED